MKQLNIVHVITSLDTGGAEVMLSKIVESTDTEKFRTTIISLKSGGNLVPIFEKMGVSVIGLGMSGAGSSALGLFRLWRQIRKINPDVVQTWLYHSDLMGYLAGRIAGASKIAWNIRCSDMGPAYYRGLVGIIVRCNAYLSGQLDAIVINSRAGQIAHQARGYSSNRWHIIPNGFDLERFQPDTEASQRLKHELGLSVPSVVVGLVARLDPVKGHENFLRAAAILAEQYNDVHFALVGEGCSWGERSFEDLVPAGIERRLHPLGRRDDVFDLTAGFDIAVCASDTEGFSNTVGEAMACGVPCVVTDAGDNAVIVGESGFVVPPADPQAMASALGKLIENGSAERLRLGRMARQRIIDNYSISAVVRRYEDLYLSLAQMERSEISS